jgi:hypothetical protein
LKLIDKKNLMLLKRRNPKEDLWIVLFYRGGALHEHQAETIKTLA